MLTPDQQSTLNYHLRVTNLLINEELILELTDHYTNALNERVATGMTFETALTDVQRTFGGRKGLQRMERQYNNVTFKKYDILFMDYVREQGRWPRLLLPMSLYFVSFWAMTHKPKPTIFSATNLIFSMWGGMALGFYTIFLLTKFSQLIVRNSFAGKSLPHEAIYLVTRFLPIILFQYAFSAVLVYFAQSLPPYIYEASMSASASMTIVYMLSYSRFYQSILKNPSKGG